MKNRVSELVDGELDSVEASEVIDTIKSNSDLLTDWEIYHVIGDSLRQSTVSMDISERVRNQLADEPFLLAPYPHKLHPDRKKKLVGLSIAASVVALSVGWLVSQSVEQPEIVRKEMYMTNGYVPSAGERRSSSSMAFQPVSAYSPPSTPGGGSYGHDPLMYKDITYERPVRHPVEAASSSESVEGHAVSATE